MSKDQKTTLLHILTAAAMLVVFHFLPWDQIPGLSARDVTILKLLCYLIPYLTVGHEVLLESAHNIKEGEFFDEAFLMMLATVGALIIGEYPEATAVMLFYELGELFADVAVDRSRQSIEALMDILPQEAIVLRDGQEIEVKPEEVQPGEIVLVRPGEKLPLDGNVIEGTSALNTATLTGESLPVDISVGSHVLSGSINLTSAIKVRATSIYQDSAVAQILDMVENSADAKSHSEKFITRFAHWYTPIVVIGAVLLALGFAIFSDLGIRASLYRGLVFLVVSCPCALVVSVPLTFFGGIGAASRRGILIKGSHHLETLARLDALVLDKTGTLTEGAFTVEGVYPSAKELVPEQLLEIAAIAEQHSHHPVAASITRAYHGTVDPARLGQADEIAGAGLRAIVDGVTYYVGNAKLMEDVRAVYEDPQRAGTIVHVARAATSGSANASTQGATYLGYIVISDQIKEDSASALKALREAGIAKIVMLTGDNEQVATDVAAKVGLSEFYAGLLPGDKVTRLQSVRQTAKAVAFAGDGINDAPVLMAADLGIAMGALGSDIAIESADVVILDDHLTRIPEAIRLARRTMRIVKENIVLSLLVKVVILALGAFGLSSMRLAIFGDVGVLILAVANALRALKTK